MQTELFKETDKNMEVLAIRLTTNKTAQKKKKFNLRNYTTAAV